MQRLWHEGREAATAANGPEQLGCMINEVQMWGGEALAAPIWTKDGSKGKGENVYLK